MSIAKNIEIIREQMAKAASDAGRNIDEVLLIAASKMNPAEKVREAILGGVDACGENRVQEMVAKLEEGAYDGAPLHFIGHLQKNKVKNVVGKVSLIQSVDSLELAAVIDKTAGNLGIVQDVLIELNIGAEENKTGLSVQNLSQILDKTAELSHVKVRGLMTIPPFSTESLENRRFFAEMYKLFIDIRAKKYDNVNMEFLSMGMSGDFCDAISEGANMVRVGSAIFGDRQY